MSEAARASEIIAASIRVFPFASVLQLPRGGLVAPGFRFDQGISRRLKPSRWEDQRRWTRVWPGPDVTWNGEQSPYETLDIGRGQGSVT